jgi:hypothetical protein
MEVLDLAVETNNPVLQLMILASTNADSVYYSRFAKEIISGEKKPTEVAAFLRQRGEARDIDHLDDIVRRLGLIEEGKIEEAFLPVAD